eukprot:jgi/Undpi1/2828/HiC_scaffold_14.g06205.m1
MRQVERLEACQINFGNLAHTLVADESMPVTILRVADVQAKQDATQPNGDRKFFAPTKRQNTILGRRMLFFARESDVAEMRPAARSSRQAIQVLGCMSKSRVAATSTPGVVAAYELSCGCFRCRNRQEHDCPLIHHGIFSPPVEWARRAQPQDQVSQREEEVDNTFNRMQHGLPHGSTALMRVNPGENREMGAIARKAPHPWDRTLASDGMFEIGDIMVWIHDIPRTSGGRDGRQFMVSPDTVSNTNQRAIPPFYPFSAGDAHDVLHEAKLERSWSVDAKELSDKGRP